MSPSQHRNKTPYNLSIIIVNWNTGNLIQDCLDSIQANMTQSPHLQVETIVIDNASQDNSVTILENNYPWIDLITNTENVGFARANNQGIRVSQGQNIMLLNPDTIVKTQTIQTLIDFLKQYPAAGVVGPLTLNPDQSLQTSAYPRPTLFREAWRLFHFDMFYPIGSYRMSAWNCQHPRQVDSLLGACLVIRRQILDEVGLLDEDYFMYSEEIDLCARIQRAGWDLYWVPTASIIHYGGQSTKHVATAMFIQLYQSKLIFFRKHYGPQQGQAYKHLIKAAALTRLSLNGLAQIIKPTGRDRYQALAVNYQALLQQLPQL